MRELQILITKLDNIIKGYLCSGRFGAIEFDIDDVDQVGSILRRTHIQHKKTRVISDESGSSEDTFSMVATAVTNSTAKMMEWFESGFRFLSDKQITTHRFSTLAWLYAIRNSLVNFNQEFDDIKTGNQLREFNQAIFLLIDELFKNVRLLMETPSDNDEPIVKTWGNEKFNLVGLKDNESLLSSLLQTELLCANYSAELIQLVEERITSKEQLIIAMSRDEKHKLENDKMRDTVNVLQKRVSHLVVDLERSRQLESTRLRDLDESNQRFDRLTSDLDLKTRQHADLQRQIESIREDKNRLSNELTQKSMDDSSEALARELDDLQKKFESVAANAADAEQEASQLREQIEYERSFRNELQENISHIQEHQGEIQQQIDNEGQADNTIVKDVGALRSVLERVFAEAEDDQAQIDEIHLEELGSSLDQELVTAPQLPRYPHYVEPDPELQCTKAQHAVYMSDEETLRQILTAEPSLLNAICRSENDALGSKSLVEIALFHPYHTIRKRVEKLAVLRYLLQRRPDLSYAALYDTIKSKLSSLSAELKMEFCRYAVAHKTCTTEAFADFESRAQAINDSVSLLKENKNAILFENKTVSELLADLQNVLHAYQLLCDGYLGGHFESFKNNVSSFLKDPSIIVNSVLLYGSEQKKEDEAFKRKVGKLHYMAEMLEFLEPKYAVMMQHSYGVDKNHFESKVVSLNSDEQQDKDYLREPNGPKLSNNIDEQQQSLLVAYGELIKSLFIIIMRFGIVLSSPDGFNDYQIKMINLYQAAKLQAEKLNDRPLRFNKMN